MSHEIPTLTFWAAARNHPPPGKALWPLSLLSVLLQWQTGVLCGTLGDKLPGKESRRVPTHLPKRFLFLLYWLASPHGRVSLEWHSLGDSCDLSHCMPPTFSMSPLHHRSPHLHKSSWSLLPTALDCWTSFLCRYLTSLISLNSPWEQGENKSNRIFRVDVLLIESPI